VSDIGSGMCYGLWFPTQTALTVSKSYNTIVPFKPLALFYFIALNFLF